MLFRLFLGAKPFGWPKGGLFWQEYDPIIRHVIVLSGPIAQKP